MTFVAHEAVMLPATCEAVFHALTDPDRVTAWWGEAGVYRMVALDHDLRTGGQVAYTSRHPDRTVLGKGTYHLVDPPRALAYTRRYTEGFPCAEETLIRYDLDTTSEGWTLLRVTHSGFLTQAMRERHADGWHRVLSWLRSDLWSRSGTRHEDATPVVLRRSGRRTRRLRDNAPAAVMERITAGATA